MKHRIPLIVAVVGALLVGGATTGTTRASWVDQAPLQASAVSSGSMGFTATSPAAVTVGATDGASADTTFVVDDTSVGKNLEQRITATVAGAPAGITARIGTSCGSAATASVFVDTTPTSADQTLCVRVTASSAAVGGDVTVNISGAQRPTGWTTSTTNVSVPVTVNTGLTLSCGESTTPSPRYRMTWNDVGADGYLVLRAPGQAGPWQLVGGTVSDSLQHLEDQWANGQQSYFTVVAIKDWREVGTSNILSVRRNGNSHNFTCGAP